MAIPFGYSIGLVTPYNLLCHTKAIANCVLRVFRLQDQLNPKKSKRFHTINIYAPSLGTKILHSQQPNSIFEGETK